MKNILSLVVVFFLLTSISWATNFGSSLDGESANITFSHTSDLDSVHAWFGYDGDASGADSANLYYWKKLIPCFGNDKIAMADNVALDSIGTHVLKIVYWPPDGSDSIATGIWLHRGVGAVPDSTLGDVSDLANHKVGVYVDSTKDDYINDIKIADDAFEYGMFAATAPGAWWNEGKTGYRLSPTGDQSVADRVLVTGIDSLNKAISDANKANFKADVSGLSTQGDSVTQAIADANKGNFKAAGFATSADGDSVTQAIADANKENFKFGGADSVRSYLAEHDSTLLEQAAATGGSGGELCSILTKDSGGQAVSGLTWTVRDSAGNVLGIADTDASGWATFNIDLHDSVHAYPKERAGISLAYYYAEPVPSGGFCDTITATIWNYTVAGGGMCNLHINTRDLKRRSTGYGRWKMTVEYSKPGGYTDTTGGFLQWGGMEETAFKDSGLLQISVPQTYRALLYDSVTDTYTDSGLVNIRIYREDNLIREFFKVNVPRDSTQYDVLQLMMR